VELKELNTCTTILSNFIEIKDFEKLQKKIQIIQKIQKKKNWNRRRKNGK
jgi:hypothetical protein